MKPQGTYHKGRGCLITLCMYALILPAVMLTKLGYDTLIQTPYCYAAARQQALPNLEQLRLHDIGLSYGNAPVHTCHFINTTTQAPVTLQLKGDSLPTLLDSLEVCCIAGSAIGVALLLTPIYERYAIGRRNVPTR